MRSLRKWRHLTVKRYRLFNCVSYFSSSWSWKRIPEFTLRFHEKQTLHFEVVLLQEHSICFHHTWIPRMPLKVPSCYQRYNKNVRVTTAIEFSLKLKVFAVFHRSPQGVCSTLSPSALSRLDPESLVRRTANTCPQVHLTAWVLLVGSLHNFYGVLSAALRRTLNTSTFSLLWCCRQPTKSFLPYQ